MTNQEIMQEIKELRKEQLDSHKEMQLELKDLKKEFYLFKGKSIGMISFLSVIVGYAIDFFKHK